MKICVRFNGVWQYETALHCWIKFSSSRPFLSIFPSKSMVQIQSGYFAMFYTPSRVWLSGAPLAATQDKMREALYCCSQPFYQGPKGIRVMVFGLELCFLPYCFLNFFCHSNSVVWCSSVMTSVVCCLITRLCKAVVLHCCSSCSLIVACHMPIEPSLSFSLSLSLQELQ